jgi:hypothetical protein
MLTMDRLFMNRYSIMVTIVMLAEQRSTSVHYFEQELQLV